MNRKMIAGLFAIVCFSVGSVALAPRTASALTANCDGRLEACADNAISDYDDCVCNVNGDDCPVDPDPTYLAPAPSSSSVPACVAGLQLDLSKCIGQYLACKIAPSAKPMN